MDGNYGLYYYKLESSYPGDVTKNCKLTINEIDSNFFNLKSADIVDFTGKTTEEGEKQLVLKRTDGTTLVLNIDDILPGLPLNFDVDKEVNPDGTITLTISYDEPNGQPHSEVVSGILTTESIGGTPLTRIITDGSVLGTGTPDNPLKLNPIERTGTYRPAIDLIKELPDKPALGDRYILLECKDNKGFLYNLQGIQEIIDKLNEQGGGWRVPSADDWDGLINTVDENPCAESNSSARPLKKDKITGWDGANQTGLSIYPLGYGNASGDYISGMNASYWSSNITTGVCEDQSTGVAYQFNTSDHVTKETLTDRYFSVRLTKDCSAGANYDSEFILGQGYSSTIVGDKDDVYCGIWTKENLRYRTTDGTYIELTESGTCDEEVFVLVEFDGNGWVRRELLPGDSIVLTDPQNLSGTPYTEYRVILDEDGKPELLPVDVLILEQAMDDFSGAISSITENVEHLMDCCESMSGLPAAVSAITENMLADGHYSVSSGSTDLTLNKVNGEPGITISFDFGEI